MLKQRCFYIAKANRLYLFSIAFWISSAVAEWWHSALYKQRNSHCFCICPFLSDLFAESRKYISGWESRRFHQKKGEKNMLFQAQLSCSCNVLNACIVYSQTESDRPPHIKKSGNRFLPVQSQSDLQVNWSWRVKVHPKVKEVLNELKRPI